MPVQCHASHDPIRFNRFQQAADRRAQFARIPRSYTGRPVASRDSNPPWRIALKAHMDRVGAMSTLLAGSLGLGFHDSQLIGEAARVHDVGKLFISPAILEKPGPLDEQETQTMRQHTIWGHATLKLTRDPAQELAAEVALQHHENWDGGGYPYGLSGEEIGLAARIVSVCDVYDSLREARPYKPALGHDRALRIMTEGDDRIRPTMFDPSILHAFVGEQQLYRQCRSRALRTMTPALAAAE